MFFNGYYDEDIVIPCSTKCFDDTMSPSDSSHLREIYIPDTITSLRTQVLTNDTFFFGNGEIENLNLDCIEIVVKGTIVAKSSIAKKMDTISA